MAVSAHLDQSESQTYTHLFAEQQKICHQWFFMLSRDLAVEAYFSCLFCPKRK